MLPKTWRVKVAKLSLRRAAEKLGVSAPALQNYENGRRDAPNTVGLAYERVSKEKVTAEDLNRVRRKYLAKQEREEEGNRRAVAV